jgi:hypothetical protein
MSYYRSALGIELTATPTKATKIATPWTASVPPPKPTLPTLPTVPGTSVLAPSRTSERVHTVRGGTRDPRDQRGRDPDRNMARIQGRSRDQRSPAATGPRWGYKGEGGVHHVPMKPKGEAPEPPRYSGPGLALPGAPSAPLPPKPGASWTDRIRQVAAVPKGIKLAAPKLAARDPELEPGAPGSSAPSTVVDRFGLNLTVSGGSGGAAAPAGSGLKLTDSAPGMPGFTVRKAVSASKKIPPLYLAGAAAGGLALLYYYTKRRK